MTRTKNAARRGAKRPREPHQSNGASAASSSDPPSPKRLHVSEHSHHPDSPPLHTSLAGIAFEDRHGDPDSDLDHEQSENTDSPDELLELNNDLIKSHIREELADLENRPDGNDQHIPDTEAEEIGSTDDEDGDEDNHEPGEIDEHWPRPTGMVRRADRPPRRQLCTRPARSVFAAIAREEDDDSGDRDPGELDGDYTPDTEIAARVPTVDNLENKKFKSKKRAFYNPRMWPAGAQVPELYNKANKEAAAGKGIECLETGVTLDDDDNCAIGTLWSEMRKHPLSGRKPWGSSQLDRNDFLKACMRMGKMIEPERMSSLLGGGHRSEDYCRFVLAGMLGILNIRHMRKRLREGGQPQVKDVHSEVVVYADELYESDDELVKRSDAVQEKMEKVRMEFVKLEQEAAVVDVGEAPAGDGDEEEVDDEPTRLLEELKLTSEPEESFASLLSYVQRKYLTDIMGKEKEKRVFQAFFHYAAGLGMTFECRSSLFSTLPESTLPKETIQLINDSRKDYEDRRKWLTEPMPAPELGPGGTVKHGVIELWRHASKRFSSKHMARLSLIQPNHLLDWLTFVTSETNFAKNENDYYRDNKPVVSIAPIPLLHLADLAADFALKVLSVATVLVKEELYEADDEDCGVISEDDIRCAAASVIQDLGKQKAALQIFSESVTDQMGHPFPALWPELVQRPLSEGEDVVLCDRVPANSFRIPVNAVNEARAVLDSLRKPVRRLFYTRRKMFNSPDPLSFMTKEEQGRSWKSKKQWLEIHGYKHTTLSENDDDDSAEELISEPHTDRAPDPSAMGSDAPADPTPDPPRNSPTDASGHSAADVSANPVVDPSAHSAADPGGNPAAMPDGNPPDPSLSNPITSKPIEFNDHGEVIFDLSQDDLSVSISVADVITRKFGREVMLGRIRARSAPSQENADLAASGSGKSLACSLNETKKFNFVPGAAVSYHRLGWICLHALGQSDEIEDDDHLLGYGSTAHYTNFGGLGRSDKVTMSQQALSALTALADQIVRSEAEILMACAAHDDGRPWIDRADVVLVNSVRKEDYIYGDL